MADGIEGHGAQVDGICPQGQGLEALAGGEKAPGNDQAHLAVHPPGLEVLHRPAEPDDGGQAEVILQDGGGGHRGRLGPFHGEKIHTRLQAEVDLPLQVVGEGKFHPHRHASAHLPQKAYDLRQIFPLTQGGKLRADQVGEGGLGPAGAGPLAQLDL